MIFVLNCKCQTAKAIFDDYRNTEFIFAVGCIEIETCDEMRPIPFLISLQLTVTTWIIFQYGSRKKKIHILLSCLFRWFLKYDINIVPVFLFFVLNNNNIAFKRLFLIIYLFISLLKNLCGIENCFELLKCVVLYQKQCTLHKFCFFFKSAS